MVKKVEITASVKDNGPDDVLSVKIGDEHEKPIHELGDGITIDYYFNLPIVSP